jgi:hypothetical protein
VPHHQGNQPRDVWCRSGSVPIREDWQTSERNRRTMPADVETEPARRASLLVAAKYPGIQGPEERLVRLGRLEPAAFRRGVFPHSPIGVADMSPV